MESYTAPVEKARLTKLYGDFIPATWSYTTSCMDLFCFVFTIIIISLRIICGVITYLYHPQLLSETICLDNKEFTLFSWKRPLDIKIKLICKLNKKNKNKKKHVSSLRMCIKAIHVFAIMPIKYTTLPSPLRI